MSERTKRWIGGHIRMNSSGQPIYYIRKKIGGVRYEVSTHRSTLHAAMEELGRFELAPWDYSPSGGMSLLPPMPKPPASGGVYFVQDTATAMIKIGRSANIKSRLVTLQTAIPTSLRFLGWLPFNSADEASLHERFATCRVRGEWFRPTRELKAFIKGVVQRGKE